MEFGTILVSSFVTASAFVGLIYYFMLKAGSEI